MQSVTFLNESDGTTMQSFSSLFGSTLFQKRRTASHFYFFKKLFFKQKRRTPLSIFFFIFFNFQKEMQSVAFVKNLLLKIPEKRRAKGLCPFIFCNLFFGKSRKATNKIMLSIFFPAIILTTQSSFCYPRANSIQFDSTLFSPI